MSKALQKRTNSCHTTVKSASILLAELALSSKLVEGHSQYGCVAIHCSCQRVRGLKQAWYLGPSFRLNSATSMLKSRALSSNPAFDFWSQVLTQSV